MADKTISYSPTGNGWTSFWSFIPDWMTGMNNTFYTWKDGSLYKHDSNSTRNAFYFDFSINEYFKYDSSITMLFNQEPTTLKMFKTISLESNDVWNLSATTDLNTGIIDKDWFVQKEGHWFAFIRRNSGDGDNRALSTQGIGEVDSYSNPVISFDFNIGTSISQGDAIYKVVGGALILVGMVASHDAQSITLVSEISAPASSDLIVYVKASQAESFGARGTWMEVTITNSSEDEVEIFEISSNVFKSNP
jgi:hypothetical protein